MRRLVIVLALGLGLALPAEAVAPLVLLAHKMVRQIVQDVVKNMARNLLAEAAGPCKTAIAEGGVGSARTLTGLAGGRSAVPSVPGMPSVPGLPQMAGTPSVPAVPFLPGTGTIGAGVSMAARTGGVGIPTVSSPDQLPSLAGGMPGGMPPQFADQMARAQAARDRGGQMPSTEQMNGYMQQMQQAMAQGPLSAAEADELADTMLEFAKVFPDQLKCTPEETSAMIKATAVTPMGGILRPVLDSLRQTKQRLAEAREAFAKMSPEERSEYVQTMAADIRGYDAQNKAVFLKMIDANFFGMPEDMRAQLKALL